MAIIFQIVTVLFLCCLRILHGCVFITVSSLGDRKLELNWNCHDTIDEVALYSKDPRVVNETPALVRVSTGDYENYFKTHIKLDDTELLGGWSKDSKEPRTIQNQCLYWCSSFFQGRLIHTSCFGIHPRWMWDHRSQLQNMSLPKLFIPGTHNSGSDQMKTGRKRRGGLENMALTQDQSVWNQLVYGIRFLDLRVGYYPQSDENNHHLRFWINHNILRMQPLIPVLRDIAEFSRSSPGEIIIVDFHRFPIGFTTRETSTVHDMLLEVIQQELGNLTIPRPVNQASLKLRDIWKTNRRIVISYNEDQIAYNTPWLWGAISQKWGNKQTAPALQKFLRDTFNEATSKTRLWAAMAELTPTAMDLLNNVSLKSMADSVNRLLSTWFNEYKTWIDNANIVATDYFLGNNIIDTAIQTNLQRATYLKQN